MLGRGASNPDTGDSGSPSEAARSMGVLVNGVSGPGNNGGGITGCSKTWQHY